MSPKPLDGLRVLDLTWVGAGPIATKILAEFGAEVIKIESSARPDPLRRTPPLAPGESQLERSGYFADRNAGKRSFALNLGHPEARTFILKLAALSDVCAQSFRPGTMEKWDLGWDVLSAVNPRLVYLAMPMQGESGPHARFSGFGATLVALSGLHELCGFADREPVGTGTNYPDHVPNPLHAAFAVIAALIERRRSGLGQRIELSQLESTLNVIGPAIEMAACGEPPMRSGNSVAHLSPHGVYPAAGTDAWIAIAVTDDHAWQRLCATPGLERLRDLEGTTFAQRRAAADLVDEAIADWTRGRDPEAAAAELRALGVAASAVRDTSDLLDPGSDLRRKGAFEWLDHPVMGRSVYTAPTMRLSRTPGTLGSAAPILGADTEFICADLLGMNESEIVQARERGILA